MAKKLSRKQRKIQKQKQINNLKRLGYKEKEIQQVSTKQIEIISKTNIPQKQAGSIKNAQKIIHRREKDRERQKKRREKKAQERTDKRVKISEVIGVDEKDYAKRIPNKEIDKIPTDEIGKGKYRKTYFKEYLPKEKKKDREKEYQEKVDKFDWYKMYDVPDGKRLYFAYRSYNGEKDIGEEIESFKKYSNSVLLEYLRTIKNMGMTATNQRGRWVGSSGQAGEGICEMMTQKSLEQLYQYHRNDDRRAKRKYESKLANKEALSKGINYNSDDINLDWQAIRQAEGDRFKGYTKINARTLLVIGNAILWNITEDDRPIYYRDFYDIATAVIPELKELLP